MYVLPVALLIAFHEVPSKYCHCQLFGSKFLGCAVSVMLAGEGLPV